MKKIYLVPNLLTTANFFCGLLSLVFTLNGYPVLSAQMILTGMLFDVLDGLIARARKKTSRFGLEYDSLADLLTCGIAPTLLIYSLVLKEMGQVGLGVAFLYSVCCALRLARFNAQVQKEEKHSFTGLPTPAAAGLIATFMLVTQKFGLESWRTALPFGVLVLSYLMVSTVRYPAPGSLSVWKRRPFFYLVVLILLACVFVAQPELCLFFLFAVYCFYWPCRKVVSLRVLKWLKPGMDMAPGEGVERDGTIDRDG
ncbi:MAG: CDP-diacylglycerol--serine O-phosphatidyltransferase [Candidatus Tritonobacter lacicola]|nr:CDP-diacylglycerol--serine O-phosphatidyltransferase [Candidatus Tritonobacter lacicola]